MIRDVNFINFIIFICICYILCRAIAMHIEKSNRNRYLLLLPLYCLCCTLLFFLLLDAKKFGNYGVGMQSAIHTYVSDDNIINWK